jgi:hypothetical protein
MEGGNSSATLPDAMPSLKASLNGASVLFVLVPDSH